MLYDNDEDSCLPCATEIRELAIEELVNHGYTKEDAEQALKQSNGSIKDAISILIEEQLEL